MDSKENKKEIKCVVWDLDETLWHGILLEDEHVRLKEGIGEIIHELDRRGIIQSLASKNNYGPTMEKLKELQIDHYFIYPEINWNAKSKSIENLYLRLGIGLDSILFIDDQEFEREEVKMALPQIHCVDAAAYQELLAMPGLNPEFITEDAHQRREFYLIDLARKEEEQKFVGTPDEFLATLGLTYHIHEALEEDIPRAYELLHRTNRLNATNRIYEPEVLKSFINSEKHKLYICALEDKFGSYGKIGLALVKMEEQCWHMLQFAVSCRVISRGAADTFLIFIMQEAKKHAQYLLADYILTEKNKQIYLIFKQNGLKEEEKVAEKQFIFKHPLLDLKKMPEYLKIEG